MTVREVYDRGVALLPSTRSEDPTLTQYAVPWVNMALSEAFSTENSIREANGDEPLLEAPILTSDADEIPYYERIVSNAFPNFIASVASKDDDDTYWAQDFRARFVVALNEAAKVVQTDIIDHYDTRFV